jgi:glycosyltransferase involved in cell wall biosynthesis
VYVGFIGTFYAYQGVDVLIKAAPQILARRPETRFLVVGDGVMRREWEAQAAARGVGAAFIFPGRVPYESVAKYFNAADICVAPFKANRGETSPLKLFDAFACGKPVVASAIPAVKPMLERSGGAVLVPPEAPEALAEALLALIEDEPARRRLGDSGRAFVVGRCTWREVARQVAAVAEKLVGGSFQEPSGPPVT